MTTEEYIVAHREDDVRQLALKGTKDSSVDMRYALEQIDGWQRARQKLPLWAATDGMVYPPHISMEQCSSETTARYKASLVDQGTEEFVDLTGGFGVDFSYMSRSASHAVYVERQEHLCDIARRNFRTLGLDNVDIINTTAEDFLASMQDVSMPKEQAHTPEPQPLRTIFLDPARRDTHGRKTYAIADCTPDVVQLLSQLLALSHQVIIKLSPMLDHREAVRQLRAATDLPLTIGVHILSVRNECKEIVITIAHATATPASETIVCVNDGETFHTTMGDTATVPVIRENTPVRRIYIPNASVMKAGCFGQLCSAFSLKALDANTHIFVSEKDDSIVDFPGRAYAVSAICPLSKADLRGALTGVTHANIATRNFKMRTKELRQKLQKMFRLKDGGRYHIFGASILGQQRVIVATPIE